MVVDILDRVLETRGRLIEALVLSHALYTFEVLLTLLVILEVFMDTI